MDAPTQPPASPVSTATLPLPELFRCLADPTRLRALRLLRRHELSVGDLSEVLGMAQSGVSRHLAVLRSAGLVIDRREGTSTLCFAPEIPGDERAARLWSLLGDWLAEAPEADSDDRRLERVLASRASSAYAYFEQVAPRWDSLRAAQHGEGLRDAALLELVPRDMTLLDVGTGTGFMLLGAAHRVAGLIGVDASPSMLEHAADNLRAAGILDADLRQGAMDSLPVDSASVDAVTCNMALHHAEAPDAVLVEIARVLRPGGRVVLTDLARHEHDWTREELADAWPGFSAEELEARLRAAGFERVSVREVGTCILSRAAGRERHEVPVLLGTAVTPSRSTTDPAAESTPPQRKT